MVPEILVHNRQIFLSFWGIFCPFTLLKTEKIKLLKRWKKGPEILSFFRCVHFSNVYRESPMDYNHMMHSSLDMEHDRFWTIFCTFTPLTTQKITILEQWKKKKTPRDIIILHMCTINDNHMMYGSWDMENDRHNFLSFWTIFIPLPLLKTQKIKILKQQPKSLEILSF